MLRTFVKAFIKLVFTLALFGALVAAGLNGIVLLQAHDRVSTLAEAESEGLKADCIVVLGASVLSDGSLSPILAHRVDAAVELYESGAAPVIVMSGDGRASNYDEPLHMKEYAMSKGVPESAIVCDEGGYHTFDSMWRCAHVYGASSAIAVTQEYHLSRAVFDGVGTGMDTYGVISDSGSYDDQLWYDVRECASRCSDFISVASGDTAENAASAIA